jgi:hypothetical protein
MKIVVAAIRSAMTPNGAAGWLALRAINANMTLSAHSLRRYFSISDF